MVQAVPKFNLLWMQQARQRLYSRVFADVRDKRFSNDDLNTAVRHVLRTIQGVQRDAVFETLRPHIGEILTHQVCVQLCWRIVGNINVLRSGLPVREWAAQLIDEWMPVQFVSITLAKPFKDITNECVFKVLAGSACPMTITRYLSGKALKHIARSIGFSAMWGNYPYRHANELVGLRLLGYFEPRLTRDNYPSFRQLACPPAIMKWNRDTYLKVRTRKKAKCPSNYQHLCSKCAIGTDQCSYAVHAATYQLGVCNICKERNAVFDPAASQVMCIKCEQHRRLTQQG